MNNYINLMPDIHIPYTTFMYNGEILIDEVKDSYQCFDKSIFGDTEYYYNEYDEYCGFEDITIPPRLKGYKSLYISNSILTSSLQSLKNYNATTTSYI